jgi:hypothetical protein
MNLATFQADFWHDLWAPPGTPRRGAWADHPGFAVHRNTVIAGCLHTLRAQYPAVRRLTGEDFFDAVAQHHLRDHPPADGRLMAYGAGLADTLERLLAERGLTGDWPWLPQVARLDRAWTEAHLAEAAPPARADWLARLATLDATAFAGCRLRPHPATRWLHDPDWPVHALWSAARRGDDDPNPPAWRGEGVLFTRPALTVQALEIGAAEAALLTACAAGRPLPEALSAALDTAPDAEPGALLGHLLAQGAFLDDLPGD